MTTISIHGPRISEQEYTKKVVELYNSIPSIPTNEQEKEVRRKELNLTIDHRLGLNFPHYRREELWKIQQKVENKRKKLLFKYIFRRFLARNLANSVQGIASFLVEEYATVLNKHELKSFFGIDDTINPSVPIDIDHLKE